MTNIDRLTEMGACRAGRESVRGYATMGEWWTAQTDRPDWMLWLAQRLGMLDGKRLRVALATEFAERVRHLMTDTRSTDCLDAAASYGRGEATDDERAAAARAAWSAEAAWSAMAAGAAEAAMAAGAAEAAMAAGAAWAAALAAAGAAERSEQCDIIRKFFPASQIDRLWAERWGK